MDKNFDIKTKIEEIASKLKSDPDLLKSFQASPVKAIEKLIGVDLPDDKLEPLIAGVKAKLATIDIGDKLGGLKNLF